MVGILGVSSLLDGQGVSGSSFDMIIIVMKIIINSSYNKKRIIELSLIITVMVGYQFL